MAEIEIPREAVDAGARAIMRSAYAGDDNQWDKLQPSQQHIVRERAMEVINASAPLIVAAELEQMAKVQSKEARDCPCGGGDEQGPYCCSVFHAQAARRFVEYSERAAELRAQS